MPEGYLVRPATRDDLAAIAALIEISDTHDYGRVTFTRSALEETWSLPRFAPENGTLLLTTPEGEAVGYGWLWLRGEPANVSAFGLIDPEHRGRGLGFMLAGLIEDRARAITVAATEPVVFHQAIPGGDERARALFERLGYRVVRHFLRMETELDPTMPAPADPAGIGIRVVRTDEDVRTAWEVDEEAFRDHWNHTPTTFEDFSRQRLKDADLGFWFLAFEGDRPAGVVIGSIDDGLVGWVNQLAVLRGYRRRGIGRALLDHAFAAFGARGLKKAELQVDADSSTGATALYEKAGMRRAFFFTFMEKRLR